MEVKVKLEIADLLPESIALGTAAMLSQREKGVEKYGQPIEDAKLTAGELVVHAQQEMADGLVYTSMLGKRVAELEEDLRTASLRLYAVMEAYTIATGNDFVFPATVGAPAPSKLEQELGNANFKLLATQVKLVHALREIMEECHTRTWGYPGEQVANIHNIAQEALK